MRGLFQEPIMILRFVLVALCALPPLSAMACDATSDCVIPGGTYRISLPENTAQPIGAIVFAHGYQGSAAGTMKNSSLLKMASDRGVALIAIDAGADDWAIPNAPHDSTSPRDEMAYLDAVVADAAKQFGVDPARVVVTGFSAGGMLVWNVICERGDAYAGYIPYSGTFWKGPPATCPAGAPNIVHVHGTADTTVPMEGRAIGNTRQGDLIEVLSMYMNDKSFTASDAYSMTDLICSHAGNTGGKRLDLCLFNGEHSFTAERLGAAYDVLMPKG
jgi:polyhydroxybutyrate depolymerase